MPSNWLTIDTNFPTFTGKESVQEQIAALHNYMFQLREGLQYSLQNLTSENFNTAAWNALTEEQTSEVTAQMQTVLNQMSRLNSQVEALSGRVADTEGLSGRVSDTEEALEALEERTGTAEETLTDLADRTTAAEQTMAELGERMTAAEETLAKIQAEMSVINGAISVAEDGSITLGAEGVTVNLIGNVYINGTEAGGNTE